MASILSGLWNAPGGRDRYHALAGSLSVPDQKILADALARYPANEASWAGLAMEITRTKEDVMLGNKSTEPYPAFTKETKQVGGAGFWANLGSSILGADNTIQRLIGAPQAYAAIKGTEHLSDRQVLEAARQYPLEAGIRASWLGGPSAKADAALAAAQNEAAQRERLYIGPAIAAPLPAGVVKGKAELMIRHHVARVVDAKPVFSNLIAGLKSSQLISIDTEFLEDVPGFHTSFSQMASNRLGNTRGTALAESDLNGCVAIDLRRFNLGHAVV